MINKEQIQDLFKDGDDASEKRKSMLLTAIIFTALTIAFTILGFKTPLPLPAEEGQFVLLGMEEEGEPLSQPEPTEEVKEEKPQEEPVPEQESEPEPVPEQNPETADNLETSEEPEAPEVNASEQEQTEAEKEPVETEEPVEEEPKEEEKPKSEIEDFLYKKSDKPTKGDPKGTERKIGENVLKYKKTSFGSIGIASGSGRGWVNIPDIDDKSQESADVFIKVTVDKDGQVLEARNDLKRSTTTNPVLIQKAMQSAKKAKFESMNKGPELTEEVLKYEFRLE